LGSVRPLTPAIYYSFKVLVHVLLDYSGEALLDFVLLVIDDIGELELAFLLAVLAVLPALVLVQVVSELF
jgi:hypothetical protein